MPLMQKTLETILSALKEQGQPLDANALDRIIRARNRELRGPVRAVAKVRYRQPDQPCVAAPLPDGRVRLEFDAPQRAITPGQATVLYLGDEVLGGGTIEHVE